MILLLMEVVLLLWLLVTGIDVNNDTAGAPVVSVDFGAAPNGTPTTVMPYDISMLQDLP